MGTWRPTRAGRAVVMSAVGVALAACTVAGSPHVPPAGVASPSSSVASTPPLATLGVPADDGARVVEVRAVGPRLRDLVVESPSVGTVMVRLLLPASWVEGAAATYPLLWLLHGGGGEYTDWTLNTDVEAHTRMADVLVVMPAGASSGVDGWYTDWKGGGDDVDGPPQWETFHLVELRQLLERNWRAGRPWAVAGLSMGGYGSIIYAERHPDLFVATASFSGALDLRERWQEEHDPLDIDRWGDPTADARNWDEHDPVKMIPALTGKAVYISFGNGQPGPLDPGRTDVDELEQVVGGANGHFAAALAAAGIAATVHDYGPGTHSWPYWDRELAASLPLLLAALGTPPAAGDAAP